MKRLTLPTLMTAAVLFGAVGCTGKTRGGDADKGKDGAAAAVGEVDDKLNDKVKGERFKVTVDESDPSTGAANPLVTIVEFSDFQCPFCTRLANTLDEVVKDYKDDVRLVFKQMPLPMHKDAEYGARAALAAGKQGKFWEMHDKLFANQRKMSTSEVEGYAKEIGLNVEQFKKDVESEELKKKVNDDKAMARKFAVRSTPTFFVNGKFQSGAMKAEQIKAIIDAEIKEAKALIAAGSKREEVYARIMKAAKDKREQEAQKPRSRPGQPDANANYAVSPGKDRPVWGKEDALVTIVEFSDFQCPYCSRVNGSLKEIKEKFPNDVKIVFRQLPLSFHKDARPAAKAGLAANRQGKFWEMHDKMFENQKELKEDNFKAWAKELGLDVAKFEKDYADAALEAMVKEDETEASKFGARGTPAFFVNGRFVSGAQPFAAFEKVIKEELEKAKKFVAEKGVAPKDAYAAMAKGWETKIKQPPIADHKRRKVTTEGLASKGNTKDPKVTIIECSDFDCPFCKRATSTVEQIEKEYGDKVAVYFRNYPLPMHKKAEPAHLAAIAAQEQGKFWEMHDVLFEKRDKRSDADLEEVAKELGLDVAKWKKAYQDPKTKERLQQDLQACKEGDVRGAPGFLINGRLLSGAQPYDRFKTVIEEELAGGFEKLAKK